MNKPKWPCVRDCAHRSAFCRLSCAAYAEYEKAIFEYREAQEPVFLQELNSRALTAARVQRLREYERDRRRGRLR